MAGKIFISYRRGDSSAELLGISNYLAHEFGRRNIFIDVDMSAGSKFSVVLKHRLAKCKVLLAVIGPNWLNAGDGAGNRRLDDPDDWVRLEIAHALERDITVIPVLVGGAGLPSKLDLPQNIRALLDRQAATVTTDRFRNDMHGLARDIRAIPDIRAWRRIAAGVAAVIVVASAGWIAFREPSIPAWMRWEVTLGPDADNGRRPGPDADPQQVGESGDYRPTNSGIIWKSLTTVQEAALRPKDFFRECDVCPEMAVVPAGEFLMGSPPDEDGRGGEESQLHGVVIPKPFAIGRYTITFDEWTACATDGGCGGYKPRHSEWGEGDRPVIYVSWDDARAYVKWLSEKTGKNYRLLSEAEWEYGARAGQGTTPFWWGRVISTDLANYNGNYIYPGGKNGEYRRKTVPVRSFKENPWGLYQVHGNVWQWVEDCWHGDYKGAPSDGSAWVTDDCSHHMLRGGSWDDGPASLRSASRNANTRGMRHDAFGFRVARTISP
jgi:formylglycine-generating enzyme required for sulfatase activity